MPYNFAAERSHRKKVSLEGNAVLVEKQSLCFFDRVPTSWKIRECLGMLGYFVLTGMSGNCQGILLHVREFFVANANFQIAQWCIY